MTRKMTTKPESLLYKKLKENLPAAYITRIESRVTLGIPDCLIALDETAKFILVELKVVSRGKKVSLSPHQVAFHLKHASLSCPTFVLVQYSPPPTSKGSPMLLLFGGHQAEGLLKKGVDLEPLAAWPMDRVKWIELRQKLGA
jgi:hypothetical protein